MNTDELKYFLEAAKEQNLSRASRTLGITQSTLSHAIRRLEREFGCKLFRKEGKSVQLTAQGKKVAESSKDVLKELQNLRESVGEPHSILHGNFRIAATLGVSSRIFAHAWTQLPFSQKSTLELSSMRSAEVIKKVGSGEADFGLCFAPLPYPRVQTRVIGSSSLLVTVRKEHPVLKYKGSLRLKKMQEYPFATPKHLPGTELCSKHPIFKAMGTPVSARYYYDSFQVAQEILLGTDAWALLPEALYRCDREMFVTLFKDLREELGIHFVMHEESDKLMANRVEIALRASANQFGWNHIDSTHLN